MLVYIEPILIFDGYGGFIWRYFYGNTDNIKPL